MDRHKKIILRFGLLFVLIFLGFLAVGIQIYRLQFTDEREFWLSKQKGSQNVITTVDQHRGNIYDCDGRLLAASLPRYAVFWDSRVEALHVNDGKAFYDNVDSLALELSALFRDKSKAEYKTMLTNAYLRREKRLRIQPGSVSFIEKKEIEKMHIFNRGSIQGGIIIEPSHKRVKPFGSLAGRSIGNIKGDSGEGTCGIELRYQDLLAGKPGKKQFIGKGSSIIIEEPVNGCDIVMTIDANLQDLVERTLRYKLMETEASWGCCMLMEVKTGEVKAIANLNRTASGNYAETENHAVVHVEPGSTFKTVSMMAALDDGKVDYERDSIQVTIAPWMYRGIARVEDDGGHKMDSVVGVRTIMARSSNIGVSKIVTSSYDGSAEKFVKKLSRLGIMDSLQCEIPGNQLSKISVPDDKVTIAKMAYGYTVEVSPWQMLAFYNGIANNGKMIAPFLVKEIRQDGQVKERFQAETIRSSMCSSRVIRQLQECLHAVVWDDDGTAKRAQSDLVHIAGKTGTAQLRTAGGYSHNFHRVTFVGYFPEEDPQYSCIFVLENSVNSVNRAGSNTCAAMVKEIAEHTMAYKGVIDAKALEAPYDSISKPTVKGGEQQRIKKAAKGTHINMATIDSQAPQLNVVQFEKTPTPKTTVPNVKGMAARDAIYAIEQTGMKARVTGKGRVVNQSVPAGAKPVKGGVVYLELR